MLDIGKTYNIVTAIFKTAVPIFKISKDRHLFVIDNKATPFVSWEHSEPKDNNLDCYYGCYYQTLQEAMEGENIK